MAALSKIPAGVIAPVKSKAAEVIAATKNAVTHVWGWGPAKDHVNARCVDFMVKSKADGDRVVDYLWRNRARLGIRLIIWYGRIISTYNSSGGRRAGVWARYTGPNPHRDHPHVEFDSGTYRPPTGGSASKPPSKPKSKTTTWEITATSLWGRSGPLPGGRNLATAKRGARLRVVASLVKTRNGRREAWIKADNGRWYCARQGSTTYAKQK